MIVYVESNFVLEVALEQQDAPSAQAILALAEEGKIQLSFPTFALIEPFWTVRHRGRMRRDLHASLRMQLNQLQRSRQHEKFISILKPVLTTMLEIEKKEMDLLESTARRLLGVGESIEINRPIFEQAMKYQRHYDLSPQDSIIYSAVIDDLQQQTPKRVKCFISRNSKDFGDPDIKSELTSYNCRYIVEFKDGLSFIQSSLV